MKPDEVADQKIRFNEDPACRIILLQCDAAKYGHTLLGGPGDDDKCRTMIFFENSYSADTRDQIEDRIHRRGQTGEAVLYIDLSGSDLDRRIVKALQRKDDLYNRLQKPQGDGAGIINLAINVLATFGGAILLAIGLALAFAYFETHHPNDL